MTCQVFECQKLWFTIWNGMKSPILLKHDSCVAFAAHSVWSLEIFWKMSILDLFEFELWDVLGTPVIKFNNVLKQWNIKIFRQNVL